MRFHAFLTSPFPLPLHITEMTCEECAVVTPVPSGQLGNAASKATASSRTPSHWPEHG